MAYDEGLAQRIREAFEGQPGVVEKKMFGGIAFMVQGNMSVGVTGESLMVRVGPDDHDAALAQPHARPMDFTGRPMKGFITVDEAGIESDGDLQAWIDRGAAYARSLPAK